MLGQSPDQVFFLGGDGEGGELKIDPEDGMSPHAVKQTLKKIIKGSTADVMKDSLITRFQRNLFQGHHFLQIRLSDLDVSAEQIKRPEFNMTVDDVEEFKKAIYLKPSNYLDACDEALQELYVELKSKDRAADIVPPPMQAQFIWESGTDEKKGIKKKKIREMNADSVEHLVVLQGIVVSVQKADNRKARKILYRCRRCGNENSKIIPYGFHGRQIPKKCESDFFQTDSEKAKCGPDPYLIVPEKCTYVDEQTVKLQELPEEVPVGEMPRQITLQLSRFMVDSMMPGNRVVVVGILECSERHRKSAQVKQQNVKWSYVTVLGATVTQGQKQGATFTDEEEEKLKNYGKDPDVVKKIVNSIAPSIMPNEKDCISEVKEAVACLLFGGRLKKLPDGQRMRGDINILLLGDPSVAKSQFLKFVSKTAPIAVYTSGKGSSAAGLTAAIIKDQRTGSFQVEGGAMVLADGGVVCIDEFDKMRNDDRVAIHEAMEQQTISIAKAGITVVLNTRCSVLAAANPIFGSYDDLSSTADQVDFAASILSRFDLIFLIRDVRDQERDFQLSMHVMGLHQGKSANMVEPEFTCDEMKKYVTYARARCHPVMSEDAAAMLQDLYIEVRQKVQNEKKQGSGNTIPITVRQLEAIIRIGESLARMELKDVATTKHLEEAKRLFLSATMAASNTNRGLEPKNDDERKEVERAEEAICQRVTHGSRIQRVVLVNYLTHDVRIAERVAKMAIHYLVVKEVLQEQPNYSYKRIK